MGQEEIEKAFGMIGNVVGQICKDVLGTSGIENEDVSASRQDNPVNESSAPEKENTSSNQEEEMGIKDTSTPQNDDWTMVSDDGKKDSDVDKTVTEVASASKPEKSADGSTPS